MGDTRVVGSEAKVLHMEARCAKCGELAQTVELVLPGAAHPRAGSAEPGDVGVYDGLACGDGGTLITSGVMGKAAFAVEETDLPEIVEAFRNADMLPLHRKDSEWVPSFCVNCQAHYCNAHWLKKVYFDEVFYDYTDGTCPEGHTKQLDD